MAAKVGPVVVGTDFSGPAAVALGEAAHLAELLGARLDVVHVVDGNPQASWSCDAEAASWMRSGGLAPDGLIVRYGSPWIELARYAAEVSPVLVVVGSHGRSGYQPLALGSTAARVSVHVRSPVVLVSPRVAENGAELKPAGREDAAAGPRKDRGAMQTDGGSA